MNPRLLLSASLLVSLLGCALAGCDREPDATTPDGAFEIFQQALLDKDGDGIWEALSDDTRDLFAEALESLRLMRDLARRLGPHDRETALANSGVVLLNRIDSPYELFRHLFHQDLVPDERGFVVGLRVTGVETVNEDLAIVSTRGGQDFEMLRYDDGMWRVRSPVHEAFAERIQRINANRGSVETAVSRFGRVGAAQSDVERLFGSDALERSRRTP
ncbi:MAG: hypothetical protein EA398_12050 [Deltaproteobacteria bacterium]|nr:MAG: hypothetical protein EA398_12050 [Deltaproteobacteria bacterium]